MRDILCTQCNTVNVRDAKFCTDCGAALPTVAPSQTLTPQQTYQQPGSQPPPLPNDDSGFFTPWLNMWKNIFNFTDRTTVRGYWMATLVSFLLALVLWIVFSIPILGWIVATVYGLGLFIADLAMSVRRLHDSGKEWYYLLFGLIPCVGWIVLIVFYCQPSVPPDGTPVV